MEYLQRETQGFQTRLPKKFAMRGKALPKYEALYPGTHVQNYIYDALAEHWPKKQAILISALGELIWSLKVHRILATRCIFVCIPWE